jgi:hypothetical protein
VQKNIFVQSDVAIWESTMGPNRRENRDEILGRLLPKIFGIVGEKGKKVQGYSGRTAQLGVDVTLTGSYLGANRLMLSVYGPVKIGVGTMKVFSAHVTDLPSFGDPSFFRNCNGCVGLMSWRRGAWEEAIMADAATSRPISDAFLSRIFELPQIPQIPSYVLLEQEVCDGETEV